MSIALNIEAQGLADIERRLARLLDRQEDLTPLMRTIGAYAESAVVQRFEDQETPEGRKWKASLRARLQGGVTLTDRGILRDSYVSKASRDQVEVGSNDIRARIHHFGGTIRPKGDSRLGFRLATGAFVSVREVVMPARPALGVSRDDAAEIEDLVADYVMGPMQ